MRLLLLALAEKTLRTVASGVSPEDLVSLRSVLCLCDRSFGSLKMSRLHGIQVTGHTVHYKA